MSAFVENPVIAFQRAIAAQARPVLRGKNWKPRLYIAYLRHVGCGKGAVVLAAVLFE